MDQLELISLDLAGYRESARAALKRVGLKELAFSLNLDPESVGNQFRKWNRRKHPTAEGAYMLLKLDEQHLREIVGGFGYCLLRKPVQEPVDALRELEARAAKGFVSADELRQVLARTRLPQQVPEQDEPLVRAVPR